MEQLEQRILPSLSYAGQLISDFTPSLAAWSADGTFYGRFDQGVAGTWRWNPVDGWALLTPNRPDQLQTDSTGNYLGIYADPADAGAWSWSIPTGWIRWTQEPTLSYGSLSWQLMDFWRAPSSWASPAPLAVYVHGGGLISGDRTQVNPEIPAYIAAGVSVVNIDYRLLQEFPDSPGNPLIQGCLDDLDTALAFLRLHALTLGIDASRIVLTGGSAGGLLALIHAYTERDVLAVAVNTAQTTIDPTAMDEIAPGLEYYWWAMGYPDWAAYALTSAPAAYCPLDMASDVPTYMVYTEVGTGSVHDARFGVALEQVLQAKGIPVELVYPGQTGTDLSEVAYAIRVLAG